MATGCDLYSRYQQVSSWPAARKAGQRFCWMKVGEGIGTRSVVALQPAAAKKSGVLTGAYWYAQPGSATRQANLLCNQAERLGLTALAPALDIEAPFSPNRTAINFAVAFCRQVAKRGHRPALYANNTMMRAVRGPVLKAVPNTLIWVARYGANPTVSWHVWQYSSSGHVPGIRAGSVDMNTGQVPHNLTTQAIVEDEMPAPKDLWQYRIRANGPDGKPRNPKKPDWQALSVLGTILQYTYKIDAQLRKVPSWVWHADMIPANNADGTPRDPKNREWMALSSLGTVQQNLYGAHEKIDATRAQLAAQQQQLDQLTEMVTALVQREVQS